jgi:transposase
LRRKRADLILALDGRLEAHHRFLLAMQLRRLEAIEADIAALDLRIGERLEPYCAPRALLMQIPGVDWMVAALLIAEIGVDMSVFLSVYHLVAWAGVCPGNHESAGRQKSGQARQGNIHLRTILVSAAISASRTKAATSRTSSTASRPEAAACAPRSQSPTRFSSAPITCSPKGWRTAISAKPTSIESARPGASPISDAVSNASVIASPSNQRPNLHDPKSPLKQFSWQIR